MSSDPHAHVDLVLHPGQVMTFRADLMHAGLAQSSDPEANVRMHFYHHAANIIHKGLQKETLDTFVVSPVPLTDLHYGKFFL